MANSEPETTTVQQRRDEFLAAHPRAFKATPGEQSPEGTTTTVTFVSPKSAA